MRFYLEGKIHFEHFPSLSFGPSLGHNSVNIGSNSTSRDSFGNLRSRALIWHPDWWDYEHYYGRYELLTVWPSLYLTYCKWHFNFFSVSHPQSRNFSNILAEKIKFINQEMSCFNGKLTIILIMQAVRVRIIGAFRIKILNMKLGNSEADSQCHFN